MEKFEVTDDFGDKFKSKPRDAELDPGEVVVLTSTPSGVGVILRREDVKALRKHLKQVLRAGKDVS